MPRGRDDRMWPASVRRWIRNHRRAIRIGAVVLVLAVAAAWWRLTTTRAPSASQAVMDFRARNPTPSAEPTPSPPPAGAPASPASSLPAPSTGAAAKPTRAAGAPNGSPPGPAPTADARCGWDCPYRGPPAAGVYEWFQCGRTQGRCTGEAGEPEATETFGLVVPVTRPFARTGVRTITPTGSDSWAIEHSYAAEHREIFDLAGGKDGVVSSRYRTYISVLLLNNATDVAQQPPFPAYKLPLALGSSWSGHWDDPAVSADYRSSVVGREALSVGGEEVETWVVESHVTPLGPVAKGNVTVRSWFAPALSQSVQEVQDHDLVDSRGVSYRGRWMVTMARTEPMR